MRLRVERARCLPALLLGVALAGTAPALRAQQAAPQLAQVEAAQQALRQDPDLGIEKTVRTLHWDSGDDTDKPRDTRALAWLMGLFRWIGQSARLIVWVLAGLLAAGIVIYLLRLLRDRRGAETRGAPLAPTHVRELDIRPESLPADIGGAAQLLWDAGETRRALALLYRGFLSRLAHAYAAPVRESTTEGESIALARRCLDAGGGEFAAALVGIWQLAVYGRREPDTARMHALCAAFAPALDRIPSGGGA